MPRSPVEQPPVRDAGVGDATLPAGADRSRPSRARGLARGAAGDLLFLVTGLPVAVVSSTVLLSGAAVSAVLVPFWLGLPLMLLTQALAGVFAGVELARLGAVGIRVRRSAAPVGALHGHRWSGAVSRLRRRQPWKDLAHGLLVLPLAVLTCTVAVTWVTGAVSGLTFVAWHDRLPADATLPSDLVALPFGDTWSNLLLGVLFAVSAPVVLSLCVRLHALVAGALLNPDRT